EARFILYHIPQLTQIPLSLALLRALADALGARICAVKDSSGDWQHTRALLDWGALPVLVGDERQLHRALALGAAGSISGMANLHPERLLRLFETDEEDRALSAQVERIVSMPVVPALKFLLARECADPEWERVRPPLSPLDDAARQRLLATSREGKIG
ncbi:MAG: dihydrodipicolinate synthase family protein, partial [Alphaproteobacteria bacterium]